MSGLRIFIPIAADKSSTVFGSVPGGAPSNADLDAMGLAGLYLPGSIAQQLAEGPGDSGRGYLKEGIGTCRGAGYYPDKQTWIKCADGKYYIGWDNTDGPPGPADLLKPEAQQIPGAAHEIMLSDGNKWKVPVALFVGRVIALERTIIMIDGQLAEGEVLARYQPLADMADRIAAAVFSGLGVSENADAADGDNEIEMVEGVVMAVKILGENYFINFDLAVNCLKLFSTRTWMEVLTALVDLPALLELGKAAALAAANESADKKKAVSDDPRPGPVDISAASTASNNGPAAADRISPPTPMSVSPN